MKKINYFLLGVAGLMLASCSQEDKAPAVKTGNFSVTVNLPEHLTTRANAENFGTGLVATMLNIAVFDADNNKQLVEVGDEVFTNGLSTTVDFDLPEGKSYLIAFFAQAPSTNPVYNFDAEEGVVTVDYSKMNSEANLADSYDCFYGQVATGKIGENENYSASCELYRPVAQINWGANDLNENSDSYNITGHEDAYGAEGQYILTTLNTNAYNTFDLIQGVATGEMVPVTISNFAAPYSVTYPYNPETPDILDPTTSPYAYIAMEYVLAPNLVPGSTNQNLMNLNLSINNGGEVTNADGTVSTGEGDINLLITVSGAPVYANYKTNIYGTLLTANVEIDVNKDPNWDKPDNNEPFEDHEVSVSMTPNGN